MESYLSAKVRTEPALLLLIRAPFSRPVANSRGVKFSLRATGSLFFTTPPRPAYAIKKTSLGIRQQQVYRRQIGPVIDEVSAVVGSCC